MFMEMLVKCAAVNNREICLANRSLDLAFVLLLSNAILASMLWKFCKSYASSFPIPYLICSTLSLLSLPHRVGYSLRIFLGLQILYLVTLAYEGAARERRGMDGLMMIWGLPRKNV